MIPNQWLWVLLVVVYTPYRLRIDHGVLRVLDQDNRVVGEVPATDIDELVIVGRGVSLSSGLLLVLGRLDIPVVIHGRRNDVFLHRPFNVSVTLTRFNQYRASYNRELSLYYSRILIRSKINGLRNLLKYYYSKKIISDHGGECFNQAIEKIQVASSIDELRNVEAEGSKCFWSRITGLYGEYGFPGRKPRNSDVVNRGIDYGYAVLYGLVSHALVAAGLDPYAGFMHVKKSGRLSLVYDFSEQYKPVIIHSVLSGIQRIKNPMVTGEGLLDPRSTAYLSKTIYSWLNKYRRSIGMSIRKNIYVKAHELAESLRSGTVFQGYTYKVW